MASYLYSHTLHWSGVCRKHMTFWLHKCRVSEHLICIFSCMASYAYSHTLHGIRKDFLKVLHASYFWWFFVWTIYMRVCMTVYIRICVRVYITIYILVCMTIYVYIYVYTSLYIYVYIWLYIYVYIYVYISLYIYVCTWLYIYVYKYTRLVYSHAWHLMYILTPYIGVVCVKYVWLSDSTCVGCQNDLFVYSHTLHWSG